MATKACVNATPSSDMVFGRSHAFQAAVYAALFVIALVGNVGMLLVLLRNLRVRASRVTLMLLHMNVADLVVTFVVLPMQVVNSLTVSWRGGDALCRVAKFLDVFPVYLSSNVLICMSVDRFCSVLFPLKSLPRAHGRVRRWLALAWLVAALCSAPQVWLFEQAQHPCFDSYSACISRAFLGQIDVRLEGANTLLNCIVIYFVPLVVSCVCYSAILCRISSAAAADESDTMGAAAQASADLAKTATGVARQRLPKKSRTVRARRASSKAPLSRARSRTLRMTVVMVAAFLVCWTPYYAMTSVHFAHLDWSTGRRRPHFRLNPIVEKFLYIFAAFNSCINPYLYGFFSFNITHELRLLAATVWPNWRYSQPPSTNTASLPLSSSEATLRSARLSRRADITVTEICV